jgi:trehalose utilization protein
MTDRLHALVWSEGTEVGDVYPNGIAATIAEHLNERGAVVARTASIEDEAQGVPGDTLEWADVVLWWGHLRHGDVTDGTVDRVERSVREDGTGFVGLHSGHYARPFTRLVEASGDLGDVRTVEGETERLAVEAPEHPIADGVEDFALPQVEMFGEPFDVPEPDAVVLRSTFSEGGEFRSCCTWERGAGRLAYVRPGHEEFRIYHDPNLRRVLANTVRWAAGGD